MSKEAILEHLYPSAQERDRIIRDIVRYSVEIDHQRNESREPVI